MSFPEKTPTRSRSPHNLALSSPQPRDPATKIRLRRCLLEMSHASPEECPPEGIDHSISTCCLMSSACRTHLVITHHPVWAIRMCLFARVCRIGKIPAIRPPPAVLLRERLAARCSPEIAAWTDRSQWVTLRFPGASPSSWSGRKSCGVLSTHLVPVSRPTNGSFGGSNIPLGMW